MTDQITPELAPRDVFALELPLDPLKIGRRMDLDPRFGSRIQQRLERRIVQFHRYRPTDAGALGAPERKWPTPPSACDFEEFRLRFTQVLIGGPLTLPVGSHLRSYFTSFAIRSFQCVSRVQRSAAY